MKERAQHCFIELASDQIYSLCSCFIFKWQEKTRGEGGNLESFGLLSMDIKTLPESCVYRSPTSNEMYVEETPSAV